MQNSKLIKPGKWYAEFDEKGNCTKAVYDESYRSILGFDVKEKYENVKENWSDYIHPDDRKRLDDNYIDIISKHPEGKDFDAEYRMLTKNGFRWFHDYGHCTRREDGSLIRCDGVIFDIQGIVDKESTHAALQNNNRRFFALEDNFESLYEVELESGNYISYVKGDFYQSNVIDKLVIPSDYFEDLRANIDAVIYEEDKDGLYNVLSRDTIKKELADSEHFDYYYRINTNDGPVWFKIRIVYKDEKKDSIIIGVFNASKDVEIKQIEEQRSKLEESLTFTNFFLNTYVSAYYVNLKDNKCQVYKRTEELENDYPIIDSYIESLREYINTAVHPDDRERMLEATQPETMRQQLKKNYEYIDIFRDISRGVEKVYKMQVLRGSDEDHAAFGFIDITKDVQEQNRRDKEAEENRKLVESVAASYDVAFAVNMKDDSYKLLKINTSILENGERFENFSQAIESFSDIVHMNDKQRIRQELNYQTIRNNLKDKKSYDIEYRVLVDNCTSFHKMNITSIDEDNIAIDFADRDVELTKIHLEEKRFDEYFALFVVDMDTGMLKTLLNNESYKTLKTGESAPYTDVIKAFAETMEDETQDFFMQLSDLDYVRNDLATDDKRTYSYRSTHLEGNKWIDVTSYVILRHKDGTPAMFTLGFGIVDALATVRQELQQRLTENMQMIGGLASGYETLYYVNIDKEIFKYYSHSDRIMEEVSGIDIHENAYEIIKRFGQADLVLPEDIPLLEEIDTNEIRRRLAHSKRFTVRFRRAYKGEVRWLEMDVIKYEDIDEQANAIAIGFADREEEIQEEQRQKRQLTNALNTAEAANRAKSDFLFNMSHDIRTPMNAITGFTNMAIKHIDDKEKVLDCLDKTQNAGGMLLSLINSVLEVSRIESGHATLEEQPGDVYYSFANIETTLKQLADAKDIDLSFEFGEIKDRYVFADFSRCMRVFVNVISNGIKYTNNGGYVKVKCEQIEDAKDGYAKYQYTVEDNGIGMSEEFQKHVFEQFAREKNSTVSGIQGTGLGMTVAKSFVELMNGSISLKSKQGVGTTFTIVIPFKLQNEEKFTDPVTGSVVTTDTKTEMVDEKYFSGKSVLLVEDNELNREIAIDILEEKGLMVDDADDGTTAIEKIKEKGPDYYDFILMDIQMPIMNGYDASKLIRKMYPDIHIPIIALSANAFAEDRVASQEAGMDDHVAKPINTKELFTVLLKYLKQS